MRKVLGILAGLGLLAAVAAFIFIKRSNAVLDSTQVETIAAQMLPGARPPAGLRGVLAIHPESLQVAIFAPGLAQAKAENLGPGQLRIIIARPEAQQPPQPAEVLAKIAQVQKEQAESFETLSKHPVMLSLGALKQPAQESELQVKAGGQRLRQDFTVVLVDRHPVMLILTGGEPQFNQTARDEFLSALSVPGGPGGPEPPIPPRPMDPPPRPEAPNLPRPTQVPPGRPRPGLPGPPGF